MSLPTPKFVVAACTAIVAHVALLGLATPAPAAAADAGPYYRVELAQAASDPMLVADGLAWRCEGTSCTAAKSNSRPLTVCVRLQRKAGAIARFESAKGTLEEKELARCNGA